MWTKTYQKTFTGIKASDIWRLWTDINNWPSWHDDLDYCQIYGPFQVGSYFILKPKSMGPVTITLTAVEVGKSFTDCTRFFGAKMFDTHTVEETSEGILLTNTLIVTGPLAWLWIRLVAQNVAKSVPDEVESVVRIARGLHG
jgi:hypothetical protein